MDWSETFPFRSLTSGQPRKMWVSRKLFVLREMEEERREERERREKNKEKGKKKWTKNKRIYDERMENEGRN